MRSRADRLAAALVRALGFTGSGSVLIQVDERGRPASVEDRHRRTMADLRELPAVTINPEPEGPV